MKRPILYVLDTCTEHSGRFLVNILRFLAGRYDIRGSYIWSPSKDDLDALRPFPFRRFDERGFAGEEHLAHIAALAPSVVVCWNKHYPILDAPLRFLRERMPGCRVVYAEVAWFPQREYVYLDSAGINADSSIAALTPAELAGMELDPAALAGFVERYREGRRVEKGEFVFCPLQVPSDMNIARFSPWTDMTAFIRHVAAALPGERLLFKCHPLDPGKEGYLRLREEHGNISVLEDADLKQLLAECSCVVGINSTVLLEALLFDKPVTYLGAGVGSNKGGVFNYDISSAARFVPDKGLRDRFLYDLIFRRQISVREPEEGRVLRFIAPPPGGGGARRGASAPAASVVITCMDLGEYVGQAVASAQAQTLDDIEIAIVDDGSTDPWTVRVLDRLASRGVRLIRTENRGLSAARNTGVRAARGKYICCLDADDILEPSCIEKCVAALDADPSLGFVSFRYRSFGAEEWELGYPPLSLFDFLVTNCAPPAAPFRREAWEKAGGYDESFSGYEDWDFWIGVLEAGYRCRVLDEVLFFYRVRRGSMVHGCDRPEASAALRRKIVEKHAASYRARAIELFAEKERLVAEYRFYWKSEKAEAGRLRKLHAEALSRIRGIEAEVLSRIRGIEQERAAAESAAAGLRERLAEAEHELRSVYASKVWKVGSAVQRAWRLVAGRRA